MQFAAREGYQPNMTPDTLEARWHSRASWARDQAARLHPSAALQLVMGDRTHAFLELSTGTKQPSLAQAAGWLSTALELELVPVVARAIWITQGCPQTPPNQLAYT